MERARVGEPRSQRPQSRRRPRRLRSLPRRRRDGNVAFPTACGPRGARRAFLRRPPSSAGTLAPSCFPGPAGGAASKRP
eukprot:2300113-Pyramimonas_sp.AAC.1